MPKLMFEMPRSIVGWLALPAVWLFARLFQLLAICVSAVVEAPPSVFRGLVDIVRRR